MSFCTACHRRRPCRQAVPGHMAVAWSEGARGDKLGVVRRRLGVILIVCLCGRYFEQPPSSRVPTPKRRKEKFDNSNPEAPRVRTRLGPRASVAWADTFLACIFRFAFSCGVEHTQYLPSSNLLRTAGPVCIFFCACLLCAAVSGICFRSHFPIFCQGFVHVVRARRLSFFLENNGNERRFHFRLHFAVINTSLPRSSDQSLAGRGTSISRQAPCQYFCSMSHIFWTMLLYLQAGSGKTNQILPTALFSRRENNRVSLVAKPKIQYDSSQQDTILPVTSLRFLYPSLLWQFFFFFLCKYHGLGQDYRGFPPTFYTISLLMKNAPLKVGVCCR